MASNPITSCQIDVETVADFIFLGSKITVDNDCSHEMKRCLFLGKKAMTNIDNILKSRDITLPTKICIASSHVWMWKLNHKEGWAVKNSCFQLWCSRRFLRVPWIARRSDQSILKEVNPKLSLEELIIKLKLQYFGYMMRTANSLKNTLMLGKTEGRRRSGWQRVRW